MAAATTAPSTLSAHIKNEYAELIQQAGQHEGNLLRGCSHSQRTASGDSSQSTELPATQAFTSLQQALGLLQTAGPRGSSWLHHSAQRPGSQQQTRHLPAPKRSTLPHRAVSMSDEMVISPHNASLTAPGSSGLPPQMAGQDAGQAVARQGPEGPSWPAYARLQAAAAVAGLAAQAAEVPITCSEALSGEPSAPEQQAAYAWQHADCVIGLRAVKRQCLDPLLPAWGRRKPAGPSRRPHYDCSCFAARFRERFLAPGAQQAAGSSEDGSEQEGVCATAFLQRTSSGRPVRRAAAGAAVAAAAAVAAEMNHNPASWPSSRANAPYFNSGAPPSKVFFTAKQEQPAAAAPAVLPPVPQFRHNRKQKRVQRSAFD